MHVCVLAQELCMKKNHLLTFFRLFVNSIVFLVINYLLGCAIFSFQHHIAFILFFSVDMCVQDAHIDFLVSTMPKKVYAYILYGITLLVLFCLFLFLGILPIATTFYKGGI